MTMPHTATTAPADWVQKIVHYPIVTGNAFWRFLLLLLVVLVTVAAGLIVQYAINNYALRREKKRGVTVLTLFLKCLAKPIHVAVFALGLHFCKHYLLRWTGKTETRLDDMLAPVVRKALRITTAIVATIYIIDNILKQDVQSILLGAGVGGIAIALAAKDTVANFFGSLTIFADRPFQMGEVIQNGRASAGRSKKSASEARASAHCRAIL